MPEENTKAFDQNEICSNIVKRTLGLEKLPSAP
jgi:hypothetical protein